MATALPTSCVSSETAVRGATSTRTAGRRSPTSLSSRSPRERTVQTSTSPMSTATAGPTFCGPTSSTETLLFGTTEDPSWRPVAPSPGTIRVAAQGSCIRYPDLDGNGRADMHVVDSLASTAVTWFNDCGNGGGDDADTLTTPTPQPGSEVSGEVEGFMAAIHDSGYEGTISDDGVVSLATMLIGYTSCDLLERQAIRSGWLQSWKLMDYIRPKVNSLDLNSAAAIEYLGPPAVNQPYQDRFKEILGSIATFKEGPWWRPGWFDYKIHVRCDDPDNKCSEPCGDRTLSSTVACTVDRQGSTPAWINFCPRYFTFDTLAAKLSKARNEPFFIKRFDLTNYYENQGFTWFHELLHINDVSKATGGNEMILDFWNKVRERTSSGLIIEHTLVAYGPERSKILARWGDWPGAVFTHRNNDNIGCYVLALLFQDTALDGTYPHLPRAPQPPSAVSPFEPVRMGNIFLVNPDGTATILDEAYFSANEQCPYSAAGQEMDLTYNFATRDQYPAEYLALYDSWVAS
ncbi:uncharacterized protein B0T15DRAFT_460 [Chaetomium strumarium]|uniref:Uncharacterized protein n=1 Tax=Chaetomium strumarium TaxID=1170767 RepID=A0AAJ0H065_9PEZI|nr:hypothetical protein B0T15DRAFT_460 [Chaetomium strumarium]